MGLDFPELQFLIGTPDGLSGLREYRTGEPFSRERITFLDQWSKAILAEKESRNYPDTATFAFWCRKSNIERQRKRFALMDARQFRSGRGVVFHIAPSNVAANYAYSFAVGFITGNANVVRLPSKDFPQVAILNRALKKTLQEFPVFERDICFFRYERGQKKITDFLSELADVRIIWGGDATIREIRKSELRPRATEITFADRYSVCVINAEEYLRLEGKDRVAQDFYNDTYLTDQNACTSPHLVLWMGKERETAKKEFWERLYKKVKEMYPYQDIQGVNKRTALFRLAAQDAGVHQIEAADNRLVRVKVDHLTEELMDHRCDSGYFLEYDMEDVRDLLPLCNERLQTISYIGIPEVFRPLLEQGVRGIDRIVPEGRTMEFDLIWDGYDLVERLTRRIMNY